MSLGKREPGVLNHEEIAESVASWFGRLLGSGGAAKSQLDSQETLQLFFSCFVFGPLVLIAPNSLQVMGSAYQAAVDRVENIVNQQDSRSFDNVMVLILSTLKEIDRPSFIERTGDFVSKKKVGAPHQTVERIQTCKKYIQDYFTTNEADEVINIAAARCSLMEKANLIDQSDINIDSDKLSFRWYSAGGNKNIKNMLMFGLKILRDYLKDGKFDHANQFHTE